MSIQAQITEAKLKTAAILSMAESRVITVGEANSQIDELWSFILHEFLYPRETFPDPSYVRLPVSRHIAQMMEQELTAEEATAQVAAQWCQFFNTIRKPDTPSLMVRNDSAELIIY